MNSQLAGGLKLSRLSNFCPGMQTISAELSNGPGSLGQQNIYSGGSSVDNLSGFFSLKHLTL